MLQFKQSDTAAVMLFTLKELVTLNDPSYLFVFKHVLTKQKVKFVKGVSAEESPFPERYSQFTIDATEVFANAPTGEWHYTVHQQLSSSNTDEDLAEGVLEYGKLILDRETAFEYTSYNEATTYKAYNG